MPLGGYPQMQRYRWHFQFGLICGRSLPDTYLNLYAAVDPFHPH